MAKSQLSQMGFSNFSEIIIIKLYGIDFSFFFFVLKFRLLNMWGYLEFLEYTYYT
jgi:hypothetical protein